MKMKFSGWTAAVTLVAGAILVQSAQAGDWPQWRGAKRDGKSTDTGLLKEWPADGPKLVWNVTRIGKGYAGVTVVGNRLYTMGDKDDASYIVACNAEDGKVVWSTKVGKAGAPGWGGFAGPRCMPTVDGDQLFSVDQWGELVCLSVSDGKEQWRKNYEQDFGAKRPEWGFTESPLVDGDQVVVTPGGSKGAMVALNRKSGAVVWQSKDFTDEAQYSSIIAAEIAGTRQYVQMTMASVAGISPKDGAVLWKVPRKGATAVIPTPIVEGDFVYVTSGYGTGCNLFKVSSSGGKFTAEQVYANKVMVNHHGGAVLVGENVYGYSDGKGLTCQNFKTGQAVWAEKDKVKKGAVSFADGMLYVREEDSGTMVLVEANPAAYAEKGRFKQPDRAKEKAWPHPTIANGKLYLRDQDRLFCYDVKK